MVSIISKWLQKRMPSFETIESNLTKKQVEDNKNITNSLKLNMLWFTALLLACIFFYYWKTYTLSFPMFIAVIITFFSILVSNILSINYKILKYKIDMFMLYFSFISIFIVIDSMAFFFVNNFILSVILIFITILCIKKIIFGNGMKSTKYEWLLNLGSFFALLTAIWEIFFGKGNLEDFIEAIFIIIFFSVIYKISLNAFADHYKTLFYLLTYPEEFRKKFGYSIKDWYGVHSSQYKESKCNNIK